MTFIFPFKYILEYFYVKEWIKWMNTREIKFLSSYNLEI